MRRDHTSFVVLLAAALIALASSVHSDQPSAAYARRSYRLGATLSEVRALPFPDDKDWPGARLVLSSEKDREGIPAVFFFGAWADCGVIKGQFSHPRTYERTTLDEDAGLWLGDVWNRTALYFYQPEAANEPILFYIETTGRSEDFDRLKALFKKTYGEPTSRSNEAVQNGLGASFANETIQYRNDTSSMTLKRYGDDLETGSVTHVYFPVYRELTKKLKQKDNEAAKKL